MNIGMSLPHQASLITLTPIDEIVNLRFHSELVDEYHTCQKYRQLKAIVHNPTFIFVTILLPAFIRMMIRFLDMSEKHKKPGRYVYMFMG